MCVSNCSLFRRSASGFTFIELIISISIFSLLLGGAAIAFKKMNRSQTLSSLEVKQRQQLAMVGFLMGRDIQNAAFFSGSTNAIGFFEGVRTYGILPYPFPGSDANSDGIQIFTDDEGLSKASIFEVATVTNNISPGVARIEVVGDFRPITSLTEDLFAMTNGKETELFKISGNITYSSTPNISTILVNAAVPNWLTSEIGGEFNPRVYRLRRIIYRLSSDGESLGLYRGVNGSFKSISGDVTDLTIRYELGSRQGEVNQADCTSKNLSRRFDHDTLSSQCNWNDVRSVKVECKFVVNYDSESKEFSYTFSAIPHSYIEN